MRVLNKKHWPSALQIRVVDNTPSSPPGWTNTYVDKRETWCKENLPKDQWYVYKDDYTSWKIFAFKDVHDLTAFTLIWK